MYKITLKPMQPFFFGGEHSSSDESGYDRYYMRSEKFPQQTQLFGMLRKVIMFNEDILKVYPKGDFVPKNRKEKGRKLVGGAWHIDADEINLGHILSLSPLFLSHGTKLYMQAPLDTGLRLHPRAGKAYYNGTLQKVYQLMREDCKPFDSKTDLFDGFLSTSGENIKSEDVFKASEQVGNKKLYEGGTDDEAFYKKRSYVFADKSYGFTFFLKHNGIKPIEDVGVTLGADQSRFMLHVEEVEDSDYSCLFKDANIPQREHKVVLLSDSLVNQSMIDACTFYLADKRAFRYVANENVDAPDKINGKRKKFKKSKRNYFLTRGSVFFFESLENANNFCKALDEQKALSTIGNNKYLLIEGEKNA